MRNRAMLLAFASACVGCGAAASADYDRPLSIINAQIDRSKVSVLPTYPQAAVGWKADTGGMQLKLAQTLGLRVQFEGSKLEIHALPPPGAMHEYQGSSYAEGVVTIYDDTNHDGQLDYGDRVWGVSDQFEIIYVQRAPIHLPPRYHRRPLPDDRTSPDVLEIGFNLYHHPGRAVVPPKTVVTVELSETDLSRSFFYPEPTSLCSETDVNCSSLAATLAPQERDRY